MTWENVSSSAWEKSTHVWTVLSLCVFWLVLEFSHVLVPAQKLIKPRFVS